MLRCCRPLLICICLYGSAFGLTVDRVLATVNTEAVTLSDYRRFVAKVEPGADRDSVQEFLLKKLIEEKILLLEAKKAGYAVTEEEITKSIEDFMRLNGFTKEEFQKRLSEEGMTLQDYRTLLKESLFSLKLVEREVNSRVIVTDADIAQYYNTNRNLFRESAEKVLVKAIFMKLSAAPTLTEITDLKIRSLKMYADIRRGEPFEKLLGMYTDESLRARDGILGEFEKGELIRSLDEKIFSLREGEVGEPVWTKEGVYILKVLRRTPAVYASVESQKDRITAVVFDQKREEKYNEWMKGLWERSSVRILQ